MKKILITLFALAIPLTTFAQIPAFPMAFYGSVTIDGASAPVDSVVRVYDENVLVGSITVAEVGTYGSIDPVEARLLVSDFTGSVIFTVQSNGLNGGVETVGNVTQTHNGFVAGETVEKNLAFVTAAGVEDDEDDSGGRPGNSGSSRSSGGGSSSRTDNDDEPKGAVLGVTTYHNQADVELKLQLLSLLTQLVKLLQLKMQLMHGV